MSNVSPPLRLVLSCPQRTQRMSPHFWHPQLLWNYSSSLQENQGVSRVTSLEEMLYSKSKHLVEIFLHSKACCLFTTEESKDRDIHVTAGTWQPEDGAKRCSRSPSPTEGNRDVLQVVPACLGTGQQQLQPQCIPLLTGNYSCCLSLLTFPSFPTPSSSALSFSDKENWDGNELTDPVRSAAPIFSLSSSTKFQHISLLLAAASSATAPPSHLPLAQSPNCLLHHTQRKQPPNPPGDTSAREENAPGHAGYSLGKIKPNTATKVKRQDVLHLQQYLYFTVSHNSSQVSLEALSCAALSQPLSLGQN